MQSDLVKALFAIQLKVGEDILELDVLEGDDKDTLTERVCRDHLIGAEYRRAIQGKIIDALLKIIQEQKMHPNLKEKVERFVQKNTEQSMEESLAMRLLSQPNQPSITPVIVGSPNKRGVTSKRTNSLSPIGNSIDHHKLSINQSQSEIKQKSPSPNRHKNGSCCSQKSSYITESKKSSNIIETKTEPPQLFKPVSIIKKQTTTKKVQKCNTPSQKCNTPSQSSKITEKPKKKNRNIDEDLLKAYKIVIAKCNDEKMKGLVKKQLEYMDQSYVSTPQQKAKPARIKHVSINQVPTDYKKQFDSHNHASREYKTLPYDEIDQYRRQLRNQSEHLARKQVPTFRKSTQKSSTYLMDQPYERRYSRQAIPNQSMNLRSQQTLPLNRCSTSSGHIYHNPSTAFTRHPSTTLNNPQIRRPSRDYSQYTDLHTRSIGNNYSKKYRYMQNLV